jgi:hypothetical protein
MSATKSVDEDWWILSSGDANGNVYLVDGESKLQNRDSLSFNTHFFYKIPKEGVSSSQIEYYINCNDRSLREARYVDFDILREPIGSGNNYELNGSYRPAERTIGDELIIFSCSSESERLERYRRIDRETDKWALGEYLLSLSTALAHGDVSSNGL